MDTAAVLRMEEITKRFGPIVANDRVTLDVRAGTVHALLGENGAGKTTLMNVLYGLYQPDSGRIYLRGVPVRFSSPRDAIRQGIGMIHQQFMLVPQLTVAENVMLGLPPRRGPFLARGAVETEIATLARTYGLDVDPRAAVWQLPVGAQQRVEILKAIYRGADLLILDEPTSVLTPAEAEALFAILRQFVREGRSVIFITHKLEEVMRVSDEVTVLRQGRVVGTVATRETSAESLARMMVGREVVLRLQKDPVVIGEAVLEVRSLQALNDRGVAALRGVSFQVRRGEIFGVAGVDGNGQTELAEAVVGLRPVQGGRILLRGRDITAVPVRERIACGMTYIPADRARFGVIGDMAVADNLVLKVVHRPPYSRRTLLDRVAIAAHARGLVSRFDIRLAHVFQPVRHLSGGNQQKVVLAREVGADPDVLVAVQPTRGLDVGAAEYVLRTILAQRARGTAILYISTELDELLTVSDRLAVLFNGEIMGVVDPRLVSLREISLMMTGALRQAAAG
ncbi:MAG: ABC transporter ATP-binding protein [Armatimonadota bacterium]|nr:ABC transporter ATP-binding protein [Armatimonadota bacterium]MDR7448556.1 ABC transporter ATP-binding protein [Armatimonadota bacterium]MDR7458920.1 ABC transporter ATP-binding protein [Armatimonadota bacterium]MDR7478932.1 ABC transporter ATP-binding protein [Armatimonadota bacterium]MDR7488330.1 ABC transporter ATP-binding protein [Armatimonadota bacterium]